jgi:transposase-like protein
MGLSRRQFTKEFKLAAVRRLEQGVSIGGWHAGWK